MPERGVIRMRVTSPPTRTGARSGRPSIGSELLADEPILQAGVVELVDGGPEPLADVAETHRPPILPGGGRRIDLGPTGRRARLPSASPASVTSGAVSTRKLIAVALLCGLAILVAGGIQLFRISDRSGRTVEVLEEGQSATVGGVRVEVVSSVRTAEALEVRVRRRSGWHRDVGAAVELHGSWSAASSSGSTAGRGAGLPGPGPRQHRR